MHKRKLLALVVAGTLGAPLAANADTANVNVYGKLYPQYQVSKSSGAASATEVNSFVGNQGDDTAARARVESTNSYIGFKGEADVGGGTKGWFQVENRLRLDTGNGAWSSRNSAAGISGAFGNVFLGRWDTVYKQLGDPVSFLGVSSGNFVSTASTLSQIGLNAGNGDADSSAFHLRPNNYIQYETPEFSGVQVLLGYVPDEAADVEGDSPSIVSAGVKWEAGPLYVALAREIHKDFFSLSDVALAGGDSSEDTATRISAMYKFPFGTTVGVDFARMMYEETGAAGTVEYEHDAISIVATHKIGNLTIAGAIVKSDEGECTAPGGCGDATNGIGATQVNLGAKYDLSKRVSLFAIFAKIKNDPSASHFLVEDISAGADPSAYAAGLIVSF